MIDLFFPVADPKFGCGRGNIKKMFSRNKKFGIKYILNIPFNPSGVSITHTPPHGSAHAFTIFRAINRDMICDKFKTFDFNLIPEPPLALDLDQP